MINFLWNKRSDEARWQLKRDFFITFVAGIAAAIVIGLCMLAIGSVGQAEARTLLEAILPTSRFLGSAVLGGSATILALMLTVLSITLDSKKELGDAFFSRLKHLAFHTMLLLIFATCFLVLHCIPITESDTIPSWWYPTMYYSVLSISALLAGTMISVVIMLYSTLLQLLNVFVFEKE